MQFPIAMRIECLLQAAPERGIIVLQTGDVFENSEVVMKTYVYEGATIKVHDSTSLYS